ncbi:metal-dependent hydrolase [Candidatus Woesearchaeota archaeon]|nr:metal-dependent hydrolase [Candidatus Woesearchaeota archaeon]
MPFAVTHVLITIIVIELIRDYLIKDKKNFPLYLVLIGGIVGLLPDIDYFLYWVIYAQFQIPILSVHRLFTHSVVWPAVFLIVTYWAYFKKNKKLLYWLLVIVIGLVLHIVLDSITGYAAMLAPFSYTLVGLNLLPDTEIGRSITLAIDAIILLAWLVYIEWRHKISQFI